MGIGISIFLIAVGAVLAWGVTATVAGLNVATIGIILMIVGGIGLIVALAYAATHRETVVRDGHAHDHRPAH